MSRPRKQAYRSDVLSELARQLLYAPPGKRAEVVPQAEQLHDEIDPDKNYPIDFIVYRLTDRRIPPSDNVTLVGEAILPDLRLLIDALSKSITLICDEEDPALTTAELAAELNVSTKTVARWRDAGLRWRWGVRQPDEPPRVLMTRSAIETFNRRNNGRIASAQRFTRIDPVEKERLTDRARRLACATDAPAQAIIEHLAKRIGRSVEALRLVTQEHDKANPQQPIFPDRFAPLTPRQQRIIDRAYQWGVTVSAMCRRYNKSRTTIYRTIHEARARRATAVPITYVHAAVFERDDADEVLTQPLRHDGKRRRLNHAIIATLPEPLRPYYDRSIEPSDTARSLIVRYNFLKYRAAHAQEALYQAAALARELDRFDALSVSAAQARGEVVLAMLPVALSVVRRQLPAAHHADKPLFLNMLDAANEVLLEEIERFDAALSHTFESVLTNRLLRVLVDPHGTHRPIDAQHAISRLTKAGVHLTEQDHH